MRVAGFIWLFIHMICHCIHIRTAKNMSLRASIQRWGHDPPALVVVGMYEVGVWLLGSYGYWVNLLGTNHFITESISKKNILCPTYSKKKKKDFIFIYVKNSEYCKTSVFQFINSKRWKKNLLYSEMQLTVGPVGPRGQNFRGSGKWRLCVRPNDRQTFLLLGAVKNQISLGPGYLLDP
jgi:hypothetical protein